LTDKRHGLPVELSMQAVTGNRQAYLLVAMADYFDANLNIAGSDAMKAA
jgi:hypothetical protein